MDLIQAIVSGVLMGFIYALVAAGLSFIYGVMGLINFAHGALLMLSMYSAFWINTYSGLKPLAAVPLTASLMFLVGMGLYRGLIRRILDAPFLMQAVLTFGVSVFLVNLALFMWRADFRTVYDTGLSGRVELLGAYIGMPQLVSSLVCLLAFGALYYLVNRTSLGRIIQAVSEDKQAAKLMGINTDKVFTLGWGIGLAVVGVAGTMVASFFPIFPDVGTRFVLFSFVAVTIGGFGSLTGALLGGIAIGLIENLAGVYILPAFKAAVVYLVFVIVLLVRPQGFFGTY
jgi:branched-chain amino acid transport system permease protein